MANPTDRQLLNGAYRRYRLASQYAGYAPLPFPDWLASLQYYELMEVIVDTEREVLVG